MLKPAEADEYKALIAAVRQGVAASMAGYPAESYLLNLVLAEFFTPKKTMEGDFVVTGGGSSSSTPKME